MQVMTSTLEIAVQETALLKCIDAGNARILCLEL